MGAYSFLPNWSKDGNDKSPHPTRNFPTRRRAAIASKRVSISPRLGKFLAMETSSRRAYPLRAADVRPLAIAWLFHAVSRPDIVPPQQIPWLTLQHLAQCLESRETHSLGAVVLENGEVGRRDPDALRKHADGYLVSITSMSTMIGVRSSSSSSNRGCAASTSRATAWASSLRSTKTMCATSPIMRAAPQISRTMPGATSPGASSTARSQRPAPKHGRWRWRWRWRWRRR